MNQLRAGIDGGDAAPVISGQFRRQRPGAIATQQNLLLTFVLTHVFSQHSNSGELVLTENLRDPAT